MLVGAGIAAGVGIALTDFRVRDGFSRLLVLDRGMTPRQAGRMMQRLLEIDTYRLMALLALPVAHGSSRCRSAWRAATQLLSTRVAVSRERQNQQVLEPMNRRAEAQLRLQQTVEGLLAAAITYYVVGLVGYAAKGLKAFGWPVNVDLTMALSIPLVALGSPLGVRHVREVVTRTAR